jgi:hypothetical protein
MLNRPDATRSRLLRAEEQVPDCLWSLIRSIPMVIKHLQLWALAEHSDAFLVPQTDSKIKDIQTNTKQTGP